VPAVLPQEEDRHAARGRPDHGGCEERERLPEVEEEAAADERRADRHASQHVLRALRGAVARLGQHIGIQAAIRRLVDVVREEEREDDQRGRPERRHERHQAQAEGDRPDRHEHERAAAAERRVERVAPGADHDRERQGEDALGGENERDQRGRVRELAEQRRQIGRHDRQRECEPEGAEPEDPDQAPPERLKLDQSLRQGPAIVRWRAWRLSTASSWQI
jgi:hypothetical protein